MVVEELSHWLIIFMNLYLAKKKKKIKYFHTSLVIITMISITCLCKMDANYRLLTTSSDWKKYCSSKGHKQVRTYIHTIT